MVANIDAAPNDMGGDIERDQYVGSLVPHLQSLGDINTVLLTVSPGLDANILARRMPHHNMTNVHEYKPVYETHPSSPNVIVGHCVSHTCLNHVRLGWQHFIAKHDLNVEVLDDSLPAAETSRLYSELASMFFEQIHPTSIIVWAKYSSALLHLRLRALVHLGVDESLVRRVSVDIERQRAIGHMSSFEISASVFERHVGTATANHVLQTYPESPVSIPGTFIRGQKFSLEGQKVTVINLPWGRDLSYLLARAAVRAGGEHFYMITGMGSLFNDLGIEDIILPSEVCVDPTQLSALGSRLDPAITLLASRADKQIGRGVLRCVDTSLGQSVNFLEDCYSAGVRALDMESAGLQEPLLEANLPPLEAVGFVMDAPLSGSWLGGTYYGKNQLQSILERPVRGKHVCFDAIFDTIEGL